MTPMTLETAQEVEMEVERQEGCEAIPSPMIPESTLDEVGQELAAAGLSVGPAIEQTPEQAELTRKLAAQVVGDVSGFVEGEKSELEAEATAQPAKKTAAEKAATKAEKHYQERKREAADNLAAAAVHRRECEAKTKAAKSLEKAAAEVYENIILRGVEKLPLIDAAEKKAEEREAAANSTTTDTNAVGLSPDPNATAGPLRVHDPDAWKSRQLADLGLHPSLTEKLVSDGIDTIGRLEQRRADIANGKEKWPKGIGPAKVTQIEDAVIGWLTENQHQADEPAETEVEATPEALDKLLIDRARTLNTGDADCLEPAGETDGAWDSGVQAFDRGDKLTECPYTSGIEQDDWLKGWMSAKQNAAGETITSDLGEI